VVGLRRRGVRVERVGCDVATDAVAAASTFGTDNALVRADGTSRGAQASVVIVDDSGNLLTAGKYGWIDGNWYVKAADNNNGVDDGITVAAWKGNTRKFRVLDSQDVALKFTVDFTSGDVWVAGDLEVVGTSITLDGDDVATQPWVNSAIASYVAAQDLESLKGSINCSGNPNYPEADAGHVYRVSAAGKIGGASGVNVEIGDRLECFVDSSASGNHATVGANWLVSQVNVDGAMIGPAGGVTDANPVVWDGASGRSAKQITYATFKTNLVLVKADVGLGSVTDGADPTGATIHAATGKSTPVDNDELGLIDSAASNILKKLTWANVKATLKAYFDTLYQALDSDLTAIAGLSPSNDDFLQRKSGAWTNRTVAQVKTDLGVVTPGLALLTSGTVSSAAQLDIVLTSYTGYRGIVVELIDLIPATDNQYLYMLLSTDGGSSFIVTNYQWTCLSNDSGAGSTITANNNNNTGDATKARLSHGVGNGAAEGTNVTIKIMGQTTAAAKRRVTWDAATYKASDVGAREWGGFLNNTAQDTDALRFAFQSGNITSGKWAVYGYN
jgi:hypothetical protein